MQITKNDLELIFNVWANRYASNPEMFDNMRDDNGNLITDHGKMCSEYFSKLYIELICK